MKNWKTIKIFVSSTFKDMDVERDALRNIVLPRLNEHFAPHKRNIQIIDLRHSVETDSRQTADERERCVFNICMDEILSCKPYFIGLIGHRYGWIPDMNRVGAREQLNDILPDDFPLAPDEISVTVYEFLNGLFNRHFANNRAIVFIRNKESYQDIEEQELSDYIDKGREAEYVERFRNYLQQPNPQFQTHAYTLNPQNPRLEEVEQWCNAIYQELIQLISQNIEEEEQKEISPFVSEQELFAHRMTIGFEGREREIEQCFHIWSKRNRLYINEIESGLGQTALLCQLYTRLSEKPENLCFFHAAQASAQGKQYSTVFYNWCLIILRALNEEADESTLAPIADNQKALFDYFFQLCERARTEKEKNIYLFVDNAIEMNDNPPLSQPFIRIAETIKIEGENQSILAPFELGSLSIADRQLITRHIRHKAQQQLLQKPQSGNPRWLRIATTILENLNKMDYTQIRNRTDEDNEARIDHHLATVITEMPDDYEDLCLYWMERLKYVFGDTFVDSYVGALGICHGLTDEDLSAITGKNVDWCIYFRQMMGQQMISENADRLWDFTSEQLNNAFAFSKGYNQPALIERLYTHVSMLPAESPTARNNRFILSLLSHHFDYCTDYLSDADNYGHLLLDTPSKQAFNQLLQLDRKLFFDLLQAWITTVPPTYGFYHGLDSWCRMIIATHDIKYYIETLLLVINHLEKIERAGQMNSSLAMVLAEIYDSIGSGYIELPDGEEEWERTNRSALNLCQRYADGSPAWNVTLTQLMYNKYEGFANLNKRWEYLKQEFLPLEAQGIAFDEQSNNEMYGRLLCEVALLAGRFNQPEEATPHIRKAYQVFEKLYKRALKENAKLIVTDHALYNWMQCALFMHIISENTGCPTLQDVHHHIAHLLQTFEPLYDEGRMYPGTQTLYTRLVAYYAMSVGESDAQAGIELTDTLCEKLTRRGLSIGKQLNLSNESLEMKKHTEYMTLCEMLKHSEEMGNTNVTHLEMSHAWCIVARFYIESLHSGKGELKSDYPLIPKDELEAVLGLMPLRSTNRWDRELDTCCPICYALYAHLTTMQEHHFPNPEATELFFKMYDNFYELCTKASYRYVNHKQRFYVDRMKQELKNGKHREERIEQEVLETWIENEDYNALIQALEGKDEGSKEEFYYLGLAYMRNERVDDAIRVYNMLVNINNLPPSFHFSCKVNLLYAILASGRANQFATEYAKLSAEDQEDSDIQTLYACYEAWKNSDQKQLSVPVPFGYML